MFDLLLQYKEILLVLLISIVGYFVYQYWRYKASDFGAPYVALEQDLVERILRTASVGPDDIVYDLGSGDGRIPITAAVVFHARAVGIEIDRLRYIYSLYKRFIFRLGSQVIFLNKNIFDVDLSPATVVVMYLLQETNNAMIEKLTEELRPGTVIISAAFNLPNWKILFVDREHTTPFGPIYYYQIENSQTKNPANQTATQATVNSTSQTP